MKKGVALLLSLAIMTANIAVFADNSGNSQENQGKDQVQAAELTPAHETVPVGDRVQIEQGDAVDAALGATSGTCGENLAWTLDEEGTLTISGTGDMVDYSFSRPAPWDRSSVKKVILEDGVTSIGEDAFNACSNLEEVILPSSLITIGRDSFNKCTNLKEVTIPNNVINIGPYAFNECTSLTRVVLSESLTKIEYYAFYGCKNLTDIMLPESLTKIEFYAFCGCESLPSIVLPENLKDIGYDAFASCKSLKSIVIPNGITTLEDYTFASCTELESVTLPDGLTSISEGVFSKCSSLSEVVIPNSVTTIEKNVFRNCTSLKRMTTPAVSAIHQMFLDSDSIIIPLESLCVTGNVDIPAGFAQWCRNLTSLTIDGTIKEIGTDAFSDCPKLSAMTSFTVPASVTKIGEGAFSSLTNLKTLSIPPIATLASVFETVPDTLMYLDLTGTSPVVQDFASDASNLVRVTIADGIGSIGSKAFYRCSALKDITIPSSVASIEGKEVFQDCYKLTISGERGSAAEEYASNYTIPFKVLTENGCVTSTQASRVGNHIVMTTSATIDMSQKVLHIAVYDADSALIDYMMVPTAAFHDLAYVVFKDNPSASYAKVFVWNSADTMEPTAEAETVQIS